MMNKFFKIFKKQIVVKELEIVPEIIVKEPTICDIIKEKSGEEWVHDEKWNDFFICRTLSQDTHSTSRCQTRMYFYGKIPVMRLFNNLGEPISDNFKKIEYNCSKFLIVADEYGYNIINSEGKYVFDTNFRSLGYCRNYDVIYCQLINNGKHNLLDRNFNLIFDKWYDYICQNKFENVFSVKIDEKWYLLKKDNTYLINLEFDTNPCSYQDKLFVTRNGKYNHLLEDGSLYSSIWSDDDYYINNDEISIIKRFPYLYMIKNGIILNEDNPYNEVKEIKIDKYHLYCFDSVDVYNKNGYEIINADLDCFSSEMKIHKNIWGYDYGEYEMIYMVSNKDNKYNYLNMETSQFMLKEFIDQCPNVYDSNKQIITDDKFVLIKDFLK